MGTGSLPGVKRPGRGVDHPPHSVPRLKKEQSYTPTPPLGLRGLLEGEFYFYPARIRSYTLGLSFQRLDDELLIWIFSGSYNIEIVSEYHYSNSKMSHPRCVYINNRCGCQSITQQYLKRCLIKDEINYMFRPNVAIIRFSSESMVAVLYRIGMGMSRWWDLSICEVCYMLFLRGTGGGICDVRYPGVCSSSMSARCCPMWVSCYCLSISDVYCWWAFVMGCVCSLSFVSLVISVSSPFCVCVYLSSIYGVS